MEFVGEPFRVEMPYAESAEAALLKVHLVQHGVPLRVVVLSDST